MEKRSFTIKIVAGMLLFVGASATMKAQTTKTLVTIHGEKVDYAPHLKANINSPVFTGTPTAPLPTDSTVGSLELANVDFVLGAISTATGGAAIVNATETEIGIVRLADATETTAGTSRTLSVNPANLNTELLKKANINSPVFTGTPTAPLPTDSTVGSLELANVDFVLGAISTATGGAAIVNATETEIGIVRLANAAETTAGTSRTLSVNPANLNTELLKKADINSPIFTGTPTAPLPTDSTVGSLELANVDFVLGAISSATGGAAIVNATETEIGIVRLADAAETTAGTSRTLSVNPANLNTELLKKAGINSPVFTGTPTAPAPTNSTDGSLELANVDFVLDAIAAIPAGAGIGNATEAVTGIVEFADATEIAETTRRDRAVHPEGLHAVVDTKLVLKANLASPSFSGTPEAPTATAGTNTDQLATTAFVKVAVDTNTVAFKLKSQVYPTPTAGQTNFTLTVAPADTTSIKFLINGVRILNTAVTFTGTNEVIYNPALNGGFALTATDVVVIDYN